MKSFLTLIFLLYFCPAANTYAQAKLQGHLTTETGQAVPFVELIPNNGQVTPTKKDGSFRITFHASVKAGDSTTIKVAKGWVICSQYRGRFVTVPEFDSEVMQVTVAPKGSGCVLTPEYFTKLMGEVAEWKLKTDLFFGQNKQPTGELAAEVRLRQELEIKLALLTVLGSYSEETGVALDTLRKKIDDWARTKDNDDTDSARAAKALYLGDWNQAEILARDAMKKAEEQIDEHNKQTQESVRSFIFNAYVQVVAQGEQGKDSAEALKILKEVDRLFARKVSKETFKEEWGISRLVVGLIRARLAIEKLRIAIPDIPEEAVSLLSEAIADEEEANTIFTEKAMPEAQAASQFMLGFVLYLSADTVRGEEKARRLSRALENTDSASKIIRQPVPAGCRCSPAQWAQLKSGLAALLAGVGSEIGGERGAQLLLTATTISEEAFASLTDKSSRATWATSQGLISMSVLWQGGVEGQFDITNARAGIGILEKAIARVSKEELPMEWGKLNHALASAYMRLGIATRGEDARHFDAALKAYEQAADVLAQKGLSDEWVQNQIMLGIALSIIGANTGGDGGVMKLTRAIKVFEELPRIYKGSQTSYDWDFAHLHLGMALSALSQRVAGEEGETRLLAAVAPLEKALAGFKGRMPTEWAQTQGVLGAVYLALAQNFGRDPVKHLTAAVKAFDEALTVISPENSRQGWAAAKVSLGFALLGLGQMLGPDAERDLTRAAKAFEDTLTVYNKKDSQCQWAQSKTNLGSVYLVLGINFERDREKNLLVAVGAFDEALGFISCKESAKEWARVQGELGAARLNLGQMLGRDGEAHLIASIQAYEKALTVHNVKDSRDAWAQDNINLGLALLILGRTFERDHKAHLVRALKTFNEVNAVYTEKDSPQWAQLQSFLGQTLHVLAGIVGEDWEARLADSIAAFKRALPVLNAKGPPSVLARAYVEFGLALLTLAQARGPEGVQPLTDAVGAFNQALTIYTGSQFQRERAQTQLNRGAALLGLGQLIQGAEGNRRFREAVAACDEALVTFKANSFPGEWVEATNTRSEALLGLDHPQEAEKGFTEVLSVDSANGRAISGLNYINHEIFFNYDEAFRLQQQLARYSEAIEVQADFAEKHFTTKRFAECQRMIASLLQREGVEARIEVALRAIEIANLLALGKSDSVGSKMDSLINVVDAQPPVFKVDWIFNGTTHFIGNHEKFAKHRAWLLKMFAAVKAGNRDTIVNELRRVRSGFSQ